MSIISEKTAGKLRCLEQRLDADTSLLIVHHLAAGHIQARVRRFLRWYHVHHPLWNRLRVKVEPWYKLLLLFPDVRREWRAAPEDWLRDDVNVFRICIECIDGMWGTCANFLGNNEL
jgi:hypothetical protein